METKYGILNGIEEAEYYSDGMLKSCKITREHIFKTKIGDLVPQYETRDERRKLTGTLQFYHSGDIMAISLDSQMQIETALGIVPAEKILFYEGEKIKRIFPLNGKLSGYWGELDEYKLAEKITLNSGENSITGKFISIAFYESGDLKSITLWPKEKLKLSTNIGEILCRKGISFYENMNVKSFEPYSEIKLSTPIGEIFSFNNEITGLHGDSNSIQYYNDGKIKSLYTCNTIIKIREGIELKTIASDIKAGWCNELVKVPIAVKIDFLDDLVIFNEKDVFNRKKCRFEIARGELKKIVEEMVC